MTQTDEIISKNPKLPQTYQKAAPGDQKYSFSKLENVGKKGGIFDNWLRFLPKNTLSLKKHETLEISAIF